MEELGKAIKELILQSAKQQDGNEAMRFSQAALNLSHAVNNLVNFNLTLTGKYRD